MTVVVRESKETKIRIALTAGTGVANIAFRGFVDVRHTAFRPSLVV